MSRLRKPDSDFRLMCKTSRKGKRIMSQEQYEEEDFQQSGGGWWIKWIGIIVYIAIIVAYAVQTLELVAWLFPADTWFMKSVTGFGCVNRSIWCSACG